MRSCSILIAALLAAPLALLAATRVTSAPVPGEMLSTAFTLTVNGKSVDVAHAAASLEYASFSMTGPVAIAITAAEPGFWDRGVDVEPWRLGIRPTRDGQTIRFRLAAPAKLSISRPRDFLNHARMLFLFAGAPPSPPPRAPKIHAFKPGVYRQSLNPKSGETYYLAPGSYFFGSLNLWNVENVRILGQGTIVYDGPQDPNADEGWMQKPDWHCIGAFQAHSVEIHGLTCIVRSRTWSIQMKDSTDFFFDDLRVMGGNPGNANQDGMDWLGGGNTVVRNSFLRASDDVFATQGNWDGYTDEELQRPGHDVQEILIENSVLSTSISNVVRSGWPQKIYNSRDFTLRNSDILHAGIGACGQNFGLLGFWGAKGARGYHFNYTFENLFLDNWYSLAQMEQEYPGLHQFTFRNIWALDQPPLIGSSIAGDVADVTFDNVKYGQWRVAANADLPLLVGEGAAQPAFAASQQPTAAFSVDPPSAVAGQSIVFTARPSRGAHYTWLFGDGTQARGRTVRHRFPDAEGTEWNGAATGAGRFRVLLHVTGSKHEDWAAQGVVVIARWLNAVRSPGPTVAGLRWQIYPGAWTQLPNLTREQAVFSGGSPNFHADSQGYSHYATVWEGYIDIPADGGYTFHLIARDGARLVIDGVEVAKTGPPFAQVCGAAGNALRYERGSLGLRAGKHLFHLENLHSASQGAPRLLWEGPSLPLTDVPSSAFSRPVAVVMAR